MRGLQCCRYGISVPHVSRGSNHFAAKRAQSPLSFIEANLGAADDGELCTRFGECFCDPQVYPTRSAGHKNCLACEVERLHLRLPTAILVSRSLYRFNFSEVDASTIAITVPFEGTAALDQIVTERRTHVSYGSEAVIAARFGDVRFSPDSDRLTVVPECRLRAIHRHMRRSK
jgi:hypothetical protein